MSQTCVYIYNTHYYRYKHEEAHITNATLVNEDLSSYDIPGSDHDQENTNDICSTENNGMISR